MSTAVGLTLVSENNGERRASVRFPMALNLSYRTAKLIAMPAGSGETINMSSHGVFFVAEHSLAEGERLEMALEWPAPVSRDVPLQLYVIGKVVRSSGRYIAVAIHHHEFRPARRKTAETPLQSSWTN